jgi:hypothetical protein
LQQLIIILLLDALSDTTTSSTTSLTNTHCSYSPLQLQLTLLLLLLLLLSELPGDDEATAAAWEASRHTSSQWDHTPSSQRAFSAPHPRLLRAGGSHTDPDPEPRQRMGPRAQQQRAVHAQSFETVDVVHVAQHVLCRGAHQVNRHSGVLGLGWGRGGRTGAKQK